MSDAGRPRKPTQLKVLTGTARADRLNPREPKAAAVDIPPPPSGLTRDERESWLELKAVVDPMRVATAADVVAFREMVGTLGILRALRRSLAKGKIAEDGLVRPEVSAIAVYTKLMHAHLARWGLTPADRARVAALEADKGAGSPLDQFRLA